jgi:hypothetical protein
MAKKGQSGPAAVAEPPSEALAVVKAGGLVSVTAQTLAPTEGYKAEDSRGKEGIDSGDMRLPFLSLAQKTSKALDSTEDSYLEGLAFGDLYNSETKDIYGKNPITFIPLRHRKRAYVPDANGRMGEQIDWTDPKCEWPSEEQKKNWTGKGKPKPEGVRVYDWVVLLKLEGGLQPAVISFKSKSFGAGQSLTTFVNMVKGPAFTAQFKVVPQLDSNDAGKFAKFTIQAAGKPTTEEIQFAELVYEGLKGKTIAIEDEPAGDEVVEGQPVPSDKVPF